MIFVQTHYRKVKKHTQKNNRACSTQKALISGMLLKAPGTRTRVDEGGDPHDALMPPPFDITPSTPSLQIFSPPHGTSFSLCRSEVWGGEGLAV